MFPPKDLNPDEKATRAARRVALRIGGALAVLAGVLVGAATMSAAPVAADVHAFTTAIWSANARGDVTSTGNVVVRCDPSADPSDRPNDDRFLNPDQCPAAEGGGQVTRVDDTAGVPANNYLPMAYVDVDGLSSTFNSSSAQVTIPDGSTVLFAALHWNGSFEDTRYPFLDPAPDESLRGQVGVTAPGTARAVVAADDTWDLLAGTTRTHAGYADITDLVASAGAGTYTVDNVQACTGWGGCFGSWSISVAFAHPDHEPRNMNIWHGWADVGEDAPLTVAVDGIVTAAEAPVDAHLGVIAADGDRGLGTELGSDWFFLCDQRDECEKQVGIHGDPDDFLQSTTSSYGADLPGLDPRVEPHNLSIDITETTDDSLLQPGDTGFSLSMKAAGNERVLPQVITATVPILPPTIDIIKTVDRDVVAVGSEVTWTLDVASVGIDDVRNAVVTDPLPADVTYVPGSIEYVSGDPVDLLGAKTDAGGDDQADYDPDTRTLTFRVGAGASSSAGGTLRAGESIVITFRTTIDAEGEIINTARADGTGVALDDPFGPITTTDSDPEPVRSGPPGLSITKSTATEHVQPGDEVTYTITATNDSILDEPAAVITDTPRDGMELVEASDGGTFGAGVVTWPAVELPAGTSITRTVTMRVPSPAPANLIDENGQIPNTARLTGETDCTPSQTEDADCHSTAVVDPLQPHLTQDKVVDLAQAEPGDELTYTITVGNDGDATAHGVVVTDELPDEVTFQTAVGSVGDIVENPDGTLTWTVGDLEPDTTATATVTATVKDDIVDTTFINRIKAVSDPDDCFGDCEPPSVAHPCDDDSTWSCAPTVTPDDPVPSPTSSPSPPRARGALPVTGSSIGTIAGLGLLLFGAGYGIVNLRRRTPTR